MRTDIIWPVVWGTCFVGGMILGSTGPVNVLAFGSSSPKLRGSEHATETVSFLSSSKGLKAMPYQSMILCGPF